MDQSGRYGRAAKTMAQTAVAMLPVAATITAVDWRTVVGTAALAGDGVVLTSLGGPARVGQGGLKEVILLSSGRRGYCAALCCEIATSCDITTFWPWGIPALF